MRFQPERVYWFLKTISNEKYSKKKPNSAAGSKANVHRSLYSPKAFVSLTPQFISVFGCLLVEPTMRISLCSSLLFLMTICPLLLRYSIPVASGQHFGDQQSSMLQFKDSLKFDTDRSTKLAHWNRSVDCCLWEGVSCDKGLVIGLDLSNESISGRLDNSSTIFNLQYLQSLDLSYNSLEGSIPVALFSLPSLLELQLSNNQFSGQLDDFPNISSHQLDTLDLSSNNLQGPIPISVFELNGLKILSLSSNNFSGSLRPRAIQKLTRLSYLDLSRNSLSIEYDETDFSLPSLPWLWTLNLASNKLKTFPTFLRNQSELVHLDLSDNEIHGELPSWIWRLRNLYSLNISYNYLESLDLDLLHMSSVSFLDLHSNQFEGQLPALPAHAIYLDFSGNRFSSLIPGSIGSFLPYAYFFSLSSNGFYGTIPTSICNATKLQALDLSHNRLTGTVPQCLIEMSQTLGVLNLGANNLSGNISDTFPDSCSLQTLDLDGNQLQGELPKSLTNCAAKLEVLNIGNNQIQDAFPCYLKNIRTLRVLILRSNQFYGPINCLDANATWSMLQILDLASNEFVGKFPIRYFSNWKAMIETESKTQSELKHLQYEVGPFSFYYQNMVTVTIKGIQVELVKILTIFTSIDFSRNNFDEHIPGELGEFTALYTLNLSHNAFTGKIPQALGKLSHLESLDLSSNKLTGEIPPQLADGLIFLSTLNLSFNQLVGGIPQIKQFTTFPENSFEGNIGLCGLPLKEKCTESAPPSPTSEESHSNSRNAIDWNFLSAELGFIFGFGILVGPLIFWKRWRIFYYNYLDDIFFMMCPRLYIKIENCGRRRAHRNRGRQAHRNQGRRG